MDRHSFTEVAMQNVLERMRDDMRLRGLAARTQQSYHGAVVGFARHQRCAPDEVAKVTETALRQFFLHLVTERRASRSTIVVYRSALRFLLETTLGQRWPVLALVRPAKGYRLPVVLSREEVGRVLGAVRDERTRMCLTMLYSCGLRLSEGVGLQVPDIDSQRMVVRVRHGKGDRDRYVPLPTRTLDLLRVYWRAQRPPGPWLFPNRARDGA